MDKRILIALSLLALTAFAEADTQWILQQSTLTYHVSHPLHQSEGVSHGAKGKGEMCIRDSIRTGFMRRSPHPVFRKPDDFGRI